MSFLTRVGDFLRPAGGSSVPLRKRDGRPRSASPIGRRSRRRRQGVAHTPIFITVLFLASVALTAAAPEVSLIDAVKVGDSKTVRALLAKKVDVNKPEPDGTTALHWAVDLDDVELTNALLQAGAKAEVANRHGMTPLHLAATNGTAVIIERLLDAGATPNTATPGGETPLMMAARTGSPDALKMLIAHGADINARESWRGQTA